MERGLGMRGTGQNGEGGSKRIKMLFVHTPATIIAVFIMYSKETPMFLKGKECQ